MSNWTKTYLKGSAQEKKFGDSGGIINISVPEKDFLANVRKTTSKKGDVYFQFSVANRRSTDEYGNTHSIFSSFPEDEASNTSSNPVKDTSDDLPW